MIDITFDPIIKALGWTLLHSLWQGLVVSLLIGILLGQLKGHEANLRYFVGLLGLFIIAFWSVLTFKSYYVLPGSISPELSDTILIGFNGIAELGITSSWQSTIHSLNVLIEVIMPWFLIFWIVGLVLLTVKNVIGLVELRKLRRTGQRPIEESYRKQLSVLSSQLGLRIPIQLVESTLVNTPLVIGVFKPLILFPVGLVNGLSTTQVEAILLHELAHIKRKDYLVNLIQIVLETIFFFNPAVWYISSKVREERENCCDDIAIENQSDPMDYAKALTLIGSFQNYELAMGITGGDNKLYSRIKRMFNPIKRTTMKDKLITMLILGIALLSLSVYTLKSYSSINDTAISETVEIPSNILKAETTGALMTPAMITLLESVKSKGLIIDDGDDDKKDKKKKKRSSKAKLEKELKAKEAQIRALEEKLAEKEARELRDEARKERDEARESRDNLRDERSRAREHREEVQRERGSRHYELELQANSEEKQKVIEELKKEMETLSAELEESGFSGSYHISSSRINDGFMESISDMLDLVSDQLDNIPDISIYIDEDMEDELERLHEELEVHEMDIEDAIHRATKIIELKAHEIEAQASLIELNVQEMEKSIKEYELMLKKELVKDGIIKNVNEDIDFHIQNDRVSIDGKKLPKDLQEKYLKMWNDFYDSQDFNFRIHLNDDEE